MTVSRQEWAFIKRQRVGRLASVGPKGVPHNVPLCHVVGSDHIYFATSGSSRKVKNLRERPEVAMVFDEYFENWSRLRGVMVVGRAEVISGGPAFKRAVQLLYRTYKQYPRYAALTEGEDVVVKITPVRAVSWGL